MNIWSGIRTLAVATVLMLPGIGVPALYAHAQDNSGDAGIELDCPFRGDWVANGGYVIAKDAQGVYHRVFCENGQWVDGGPILTYRTGQTPPAQVSSSGRSAIP